MRFFEFTARQSQLLVAGWGDAALCWFGAEANLLAGVGTLKEGLIRRWLDSQGSEPMMDLGEKPFERIGRAQFDVDPPNADFEPGSNFKKPQPDLADCGTL